MMVTFVSQCEKKALPRTRRVLDAFADRIGDNTWQTVITEDGLQTVKRMLRQTASKSTAVSCHWIRSRSRSQLLWVVGVKEKFNEQGIVAVNKTDVTDIKTDEVETMINKPIANSRKQLLTQHLFAVGWVAKEFLKRLVDDEDLEMSALISGFMHDLGKLDPQFQAWIQKQVSKASELEFPEDGFHIEKGKFSWEKHARHNEISWLLWVLIDKQNALGKNAHQSEFIQHAIFWHHTKPTRKIPLDRAGDIHKKLTSAVDGKLSTWVASVIQVLEQVYEMAESYLGSAYGLSHEIKLNSEDLSSLKKTPVPDYKDYSELHDKLNDFAKEARQNAKASLVRTALITADRLVSGLTAQALNSAIQEKTLHRLVDDVLNHKSELVSRIKDCVTGFEKRYPNSERTQEQAKKAKELAEVPKIAVLHGPAGVGKTKIALEWAANTNAQKIIWVCPRVQVCQGLYTELKSDEYLTDSKVEICTGEFKRITHKGQEREVKDGHSFSGEIILTTIDQILNATVSHNKATAMIDLLNSHVVFDEFHEYIQQPAFNLLFAELVECKKIQTQSNTLLVSATPNYAYIESLLGIRFEQGDVVTIRSFNPSRFSIKFEPFDDETPPEQHPLYRTQPTSSIVISNTAYTAQLSYIVNQRHEVAALFHSRFKTSDKQTIFDRIYQSFKRDGSKQFEVLRSGPIVQASLNITSSHMVSEFTVAENWLQRLGRLDRFGDNKAVYTYITALPRNVVEGKGNSSCTRFLSRLYALQNAKAWYQYLLDNLAEEPVTLSTLYGLYFNFFCSEHRPMLERELVDSLKNSARIITNKVHDPMSAKAKKIDKKVIKKRSLRGDSRFVQMACLQVDSDGNQLHLNEYACDNEDVFTISVDEITGFDESGDKNLLAYMHQKHHKIQNTKNGTSEKKAYKAWMLKDQALNAEQPIYLSYIQSDLELTHDSAHSNAIYYAIGKTQPIGAISLERLNTIIK